MRAVNAVMDYDTLRKFNQQQSSKLLQDEKRLEALQQIPPRYRLATFKDRLQTSTSLIFSGKPGTGKTHLSWGLYRQLVQQFNHINHVCLEAICQQMEELKNVKLEKRINKWLIANLLIIDELQLDHSEAGWKKSEIKKILFEIVNARYEALAKPLLLVTNASLSELGDMVGEKTLDRVLEGGCCLTFSWPSYRTNSYHNTVS